MKRSGGTHTSIYSNHPDFILLIILPVFKNTAVCCITLILSKQLTTLTTNQVTTLKMFIKVYPFHYTAWICICWNWVDSNAVHYTFFFFFLSLCPWVSVFWKLMTLHQYIRKIEIVFLILQTVTAMSGQNHAVLWGWGVLKNLNDDGCSFADSIFILEVLQARQYIQ